MRCSSSFGGWRKARASPDGRSDFAGRVRATTRQSETIRPVDEAHLPWGPAILSDCMNASRFRVRPGGRVSLRDYDPADTRPFKHKKKVADHLTETLERMARLQEKLYAQDRWAVLLIFQAMDAAGKDSVIKHVMSGL